MLERQSAKLWKRALAFEIDLLFISITYLATLAAGVCAAWLGLQLAGYHAPSYTLLDTLILPFGLLSPTVFLAYFIGFGSLRGQTPGKAIMRIKIIGAYGERLTLPMIVLRTFGYALSILPLGFGFLLAYVTRRRQSLHDFMADTRVVAV